jgi:hypothetical protein
MNSGDYTRIKRLIERHAWKSDGTGRLLCRCCEAVINGSARHHESCEVVAVLGLVREAIRSAMENERK